MWWRAALACLAVACAPDKRTSCPLDYSAVARWMTTKRLGELTPNDPPQLHWYWEAHYERLLFVIQSSPIDRWCEYRPQYADTACWLRDNESTDCVVGRSEVLDIPVGGAMCSQLLYWWGPDAYARAHGAEIDLHDPATLQRYNSFAKRYVEALVELHIPDSEICAHVGGVPLRCYLDYGHPACQAVFNTLRSYLPR